MPPVNNRPVRSKSPSPARSKSPVARSPKRPPFSAKPKKNGNKDAPPATAQQKEPLSATLRQAAKKALGGGIAGALAMIVQVVALMWMRTTINYQHAKGLSMREAMSVLYAEGGIMRFYQGMGAALLQAPLSRFGDTASNAGMLALLAGVTWMSPASKTLFASCAAGLFRIAITPLDAFKTTLQVQGASGLALLRDRIATEGGFTLYSGALATSLATFLGHYPWFATYNFLQAKWPRPTGTLEKNTRSACIGFASSLLSDVVSNSVRVVKTAKQTHSTPITYLATVQMIIEADGIQGLFFRGLGTKILSNGVQAMLFTICWRYFEEVLAQRQHAKDKRSK